MKFASNRPNGDGVASDCCGRNQGSGSNCTEARQLGRRAQFRHQTFGKFPTYMYVVFINFHNSFPWESYGKHINIVKT